jgi:hypothetical protein
MEKPMLPTWIAGLARSVLLACVLASSQAHAQKSFATPDAAAETLVKAMRGKDSRLLEVVLGKEWKRFVPTDELGRDDITAFLAAWDKQHRIDHEGGETALLTVGEEPGFTLPIPITRNKQSQWSFDVVGGSERLRVARVGRNELSAIQTVLAYYDAQREYAAKDRSGEGVREYARKLVSSPGARDGLYWPSPLDVDESPLGPLIAQQPPKGPGYWGYHYKILTRQGPSAPGGAYDYVIGGRMRAGFALVAWPVRYGDTGVMSFMINHAGVVYEKDLGPNTDAVARGMTRFDPDDSWRKAALP